MASRAGGLPLRPFFGVSVSRPFAEDKRAAIRETRLRAVAAESGESLARLSERRGNEWSVAITSVVNGLDPKNSLTEGRQVKIAVSQPYSPGGGSESRKVRASDS